MHSNSQLLKILNPVSTQVTYRAGSVKSDPRIPRVGSGGVSGCGRHKAWWTTSSPKKTLSPHIKSEYLDNTGPCNYNQTNILIERDVFMERIWELYTNQIIPIFKKLTLAGNDKSTNKGTIAKHSNCDKELGLGYQGLRVLPNRPWPGRQEDSTNSR